MSTVLWHGRRHADRTKRPEKTGKTAGDYTRQLELLFDTAQNASSNPEVADLLDRILDMARLMTGGAAASLLMLNEEKTALRFLVAQGEAGDEVRDLDISLDLGVCGWVVRHAETALINNADEDCRFDRSVDQLTGFTTRSMLAVPLFRSGKVIGVLEVINKTEDQPFTQEDLTALTGFCGSGAFILLVSMMATIVNNIRLHQIMIDWYKRIFETLVSAIDAKDPYAQGHSRRVRDVSLRVARTFSLPVEELQVIELGALLHDIGKVDIHDLVLRKPGPLTETEMYTMRKHTLRGTNLLVEIPFLEKVRDIVLHHHERYDGTGYPSGLKGEAIPLRARIIAVAEAFDTMVTDRAYRDKMSIEVALAELEKGSGTQFCPTVVRAFRQTLGEGAGDGTQQERTGEPAASGANREPAHFLTPLPYGAARREVRLIVRTEDDSRTLRKFRRNLEKVDDLKIMMDSHSEDEGITFIISVRRGADLPAILDAIPEVANVVEQRNALTVTVKTPVSEKVFQQGFNLDWKP